MGYFDNAATRAAAILLTGSLLVAGCSSSSDSQSPGESDTVSTGVTNADPVNATDSTDVTVDSSTIDVQDSDAVVNNDTETPDSVALDPITTYFCCICC